MPSDLSAQTTTPRGSGPPPGGSLARAARRPLAHERASAAPLHDRAGLHAADGGRRDAEPRRHGPSDCRAPGAAHATGRAEAVASASAGSARGHAAAAPGAAAAHRPRRLPPAAASPPRPRLDAADLFGARALAWAGGAVTALGVVLLFVFAVDRGWITPELRVGFGALASALVFAAGLELRRRYGAVHSALGAVGAGIAGGYATLLAAAQLYGLVPEWAALALAGLIASIGAATAISWRSELVAGIGLIGAMLVPLVAVPDIGFTTLGIAFVSLVYRAHRDGGDAARVAPAPLVGDGAERRAGRRAPPRGRHPRRAALRRRVRAPLRDRGVRVPALSRQARAVGASPPRSC